MDSKKNFNVFLDLDHTIICSEEYDDEIFKYVLEYDDYDFLYPYVTVARPHLQKFLDFLFDNFNVGIWTAASKNYASFIYDRFIKKYNKNRHLKLLLYNTHCDFSSKTMGNTKNLKMLCNVWNIPGFAADKTFIIDDLREVYDTQPANCIRIKPFKIKTGQDDTELLRVIEILKNKKNAAQL